MDFDHYGVLTEPGFPAEEIKELIELIVENTPSLSCPLFTFTVERPVDCRGERVASCDYFGLSTNFGFSTKTHHHVFVGVDDAVTFLFDCDIRLWELVSYEVNIKCNASWHITLRDTTT